VVVNIGCTTGDVPHTRRRLPAEPQCRLSIITVMSAALSGSEMATSGRRLEGSRTLGDLGALHLLEVRCAKCDRYGRERVARLVERYGRETRLPDLRHQLAADCKRRDASINERCDVYFPQLAG
jgi:hypothetical protein